MNGIDEKSNQILLEDNVQLVCKHPRANGICHDMQ